MGKAGFDIEGGRSGSALYPDMLEDPQLRWGFIRKVYAILSVQFLLSVAVASTVIFVKPLSHFITGTRAGLAVYIVLCILPFILLCPLYAYHKKHPVNFVLLGLFTVNVAFLLGLSCSFAKGKVILEAAILTSVVVVALTLYTFWAVKRGKDFSFLGPFLFASLLVLCVFGLIQILFPLGKLSLMIYGCIGAIIFSGYLIYDTDNLIKRFGYDDYIWAAVTLYLDIVNLFLFILDIFISSE